MFLRLHFLDIFTLNLCNFQMVIPFNTHSFSNLEVTSSQFITMDLILLVKTIPFLLK